MNNLMTVDTCPKGHPRTPENVYVYPDGRKRQCRPCKALASSGKVSIEKFEQVAQTLEGRYLRKHHADGPVREFAKVAAASDAAEALRIAEVSGLEYVGQPRYLKTDRGTHERSIRCGRRGRRTSQRRNS